MATLKRKADATPSSADQKKPKVNGSIASFFGAPKSVGSTPQPAAKFDKQRWVDALTAEQRQLLKLEIETLDDSWLAHLRDDITTREFLELKKFLEREKSAGKKWFPPPEDVYSWYDPVSSHRDGQFEDAGTHAESPPNRRSRHTPFHHVKVVVIGQDPYHNVNQAHGMAFSVRPPTPAPPSLKNMYVALKKDYPTFVSPPQNGGLLTAWADRGVLLLNTCLTVRAHEANSHANRGWERFTQKVIDLVAQKRTRGVVFMAWGTPAGKRVTRVDKQRHLVLQSVHPSPLSASRGFFDCGHFKKANAWLKSRYGEEGEIDWALAPGNSTKSPPETGQPEPARNKENISPGSCEEKTGAAEAEPTTECKAAKKLAGAELDPTSDEEAALEEVLRQAEEEAK